MDKKEFKKIEIDKNVYKIFLFNEIPEKKLLNTIKSMKEVFPKQKYWLNLDDTESENKSENKKEELLNKFYKKGKLFRNLAKYWVNQRKDICEDFNKFIESFDQEVSTEEVVKCFESYKEKYNMNILQIALFIHIYVEQMLGIQLFKESTLKIEDELKTYLKENN